MNEDDYHTLLNRVITYISNFPDIRKDLFVHFFGVFESDIPSTIEPDMLHCVYIMAINDVATAQGSDKNQLTRAFFGVDADEIPLPPLK